MTIYSQILNNKVKSFVLVAFFMVFFVFVFYILGKSMGSSNQYLVFGLLFSVFSGFGSYFYSDKLVLMTTGAKPALKKDYFDLYTVAENVSIAAGLPTPRLYVIQSEAMNAFATGRDPKHAVVAATTGILKVLSRSELEAVIAHELGHVKNYDILFSSIVSVLVGTLVLVTDWLQRSFFWFGIRSDDNDRSLGPVQLAMFLLTIIVAPIVATLIQLAVSRKREYLADATGALITRNPDALANALIKISSSPIPLKTASGANAHLFITNPFKKKGGVSKFASLFSTHPPVEDRVRILREM
ncbi:MAG: M48 family metallopeptidase [Microgenomates group bacterium]